jgi:hypothetical protein
MFSPEQSPSATHMLQSKCRLANEKHSTRLRHGRSFGGFPVGRRVVGKTRLEGQIALVNPGEPQC